MAMGLDAGSAVLPIFTSTARSMGLQVGCRTSSQSILQKIGCLLWARSRCPCITTAICISSLILIRTFCRIRGGSRGQMGRRHRCFLLMPRRTRTLPFLLLFGHALFLSILLILPTVAIIQLVTLPLIAGRRGHFLLRGLFPHGLFLWRIFLWSGNYLLQLVFYVIMIIIVVMIVMDYNFATAYASIDLGWLLVNFLTLARNGYCSCYGWMVLF